jgi:hypothetical protein
MRAVGSCIPPAVRAQLACYRPARAAHKAAVAEGHPDALSVRCGWRHARAAGPCRQRRTGPDGTARGNAVSATPHPSRVDLAAARLQQQQAA